MTNKQPYVLTLSDDELLQLTGPFPMQGCFFAWDRDGHILAQAIDGLDPNDVARIQVDYWISNGVEPDGKLAKELYPEVVRAIRSKKASRTPKTRERDL